MVETTGAPLQCGATSRRPGESTERHVCDGQNLVYACSIYAL